MKVDVTAVASKTNMPMLDEASFRVEGSAHMFKLLSDNLYENKVGSMIRELSSNAVDAHTMAGEPEKPFTIHIPDTWEPWFYIKDEGIGLSHEDMMTMYTGYGVSTKQSDNGQIGGFGLGSKTPFAVVAQFTVTSVFNGIRSNYIVMNDGSGPKINLVSTEETTEHPGLTVQVGVEPTEFHRYYREIQNQLRFFPVKPNLVNDTANIEANWFDPDANVDSQNELVTLYNPGVLHGCYVVIGGVGYLLRADNLEADETIRDAASMLAGVGAAMHFPIGSIDPTANREGIQYTDKTRATIITRLRKVAESIGVKYIDEAKLVDNDWNLCLWWRGLSDTVRTFTKAHPEFDAVLGHINIVNDRASINIEGLPTYKESIKLMDDTVKEYQRDCYIVLRMHETRSRRGNKYRPERERLKYGGRLSPHARTKIMVRDTTKQPMARFTSWWHDNAEPDTILIEQSRTGITEFSDAEIALIEKTFCGAEVIRLSDTPIIKRDSSNAATYLKAKGYQLPTQTMGRPSLDNSRNWTKIIEPMGDLLPAIYVGMDRHTVDYHENKTRLVVLAALAGDLDYPVIAVPQRTLKTIERNKKDGWISIDEAATMVLEKAEMIAKVSRARYKYEHYIDTLALPDVIKFNQECMTTLSDKSPIHALLAARDTAQNRLKTLTQRLDGKEHILAYIYNKDMFEIRPSDDAVEAAEKGALALNDAVMARYPLLPYIKQGYNQSSAEMMERVVEYCNSMDKVLTSTSN